MQTIKKTITNLSYTVFTSDLTSAAGYFETMVFNADDEVYQVRTSDKKTALKNHAAAVKKYSLNMSAAQIAEILQAAEIGAQLYKNNDDGGACNFDAPVISLKGHRAEFIKEIEDLSGLKLYKLSGKFWAGCYTVIFNTSGQGQRRTTMAETFKKIAAAGGLPMFMYYQLD